MCLFSSNFVTKQFFFKFLFNFQSLEGLWLQIRVRLPCVSVDNGMQHKEVKKCAWFDARPNTAVNLGIRQVSWEGQGWWVGRIILEQLCRYPSVWTVGSNSRDLEPQPSQAPEPFQASDQSSSWAESFSGGSSVKTTAMLVAVTNRTRTTTT